jgi:hypothetical protein
MMIGSNLTDVFSSNENLLSLIILISETLADGAEFDPGFLVVNYSI